MSILICAEDRPNWTIHVRALAVLLVFGNHYFGVPTLGFLGVEIFFFLSGFLVARSSAKLSFNTAIPYLQRRLQRLHPPMMFMVIVVGVIGWIVIPEHSLSRFFSEILYSFLFLSSIFYAGNVGYFATSADEFFFLHLWSLSHEMLFYLSAVAFCLISTGHRNVENVIFGCLSLFSFAFWILADYPSSHFDFLARFWVFGVGFLMFHAVNSSFRRSWVIFDGALRVNIFIATFLCCCLVFGGMSDYKAVSVLVILGLCWWVVVEKNFDALPRTFRAITFLGLLAGTRSFSIYLWHWPGIILAKFDPVFLFFLPILIEISFQLFERKSYEKILADDDSSICSIGGRHWFAH